MGYETLNACEVTADLLFEDFLELPLLDDQKICLKSRHRWDGLTLNLLFINFPSLSISAAITSIIHPIPDIKIEKSQGDNKLYDAYLFYCLRPVLDIIQIELEYEYFTPLWIMESNHFLPLLIACKKKRRKKMISSWMHLWWQVA